MSLSSTGQASSRIEFAKSFLLTVCAMGLVIVCLQSLAEQLHFAFVKDQLALRMPYDSTLKREWKR